MKIEIFKRQQKFRKGGFHTDPNIGWEIILGFVFFMIAGSLAFGVYLFMRTSRTAPSSESVGPSQINMVKKERIDNVLEYFSNREEFSEEILNSPSPIIDPSL